MSTQFWECMVSLKEATVCWLISISSSLIFMLRLRQIIRIQNSLLRILKISNYLWIKGWLSSKTNMATTDSLSKTLSLILKSKRKPPLCSIKRNFRNLWRYSSAFQEMSANWDKVSRKEIFLTMGNIISLGVPLTNQICHFHWDSWSIMIL